MLRYSAACNAPPETAWRLMARPSSWSAWAPHLRGAWGLGGPEVREGALGAARLFGVFPVLAKIVAKEEGRSWTWRVGPVLMEHYVDPQPGGCTVGVNVDAPAAMQSALALTYGPTIAMLVRNLVRVAEREELAAARGR